MEMLDILEFPPVGLSFTISYLIFQDDPMNPVISNQYKTNYPAFVEETIRHTKQFATHDTFSFKR